MRLAVTIPSVAVLVAVLAAVVPPAAAPAAAPAAGPTRFLVLPFEVVDRQPQAYWLREAAAVLLTDRLAHLGADSVSRAERARAVSRLQLPSSSAISRAMAIKVGQLVGATRLIVGTVAVDDRALRVTSQTIQLDSGRSGTEATEAGTVDQLFEVFDRLARRIGRQAGLPSAAAAAFPERPPPAAFESFIKGLVAEDPAARTELLERAVSLHPSYDRARLVLWDAYTGQGAHEHALTVAAEIAPRSPARRRARFAAAYSRIALRRYDEAYAELNALADGGYAAAVYSNLGVIQLRRPAQQHLGTPVFFFTRAVEIDPADPDFLFNLGYAYGLAGDTNAAIYWLRETLRHDPADGEAHRVLAAALSRSGAAVEAAREAELARRLSAGAAPAGGEDGEELRVPAGLERLKIDLEPSRAERMDRVIVSAEQREQRELAAFHLAQGRELFAAERDREALAALRRTVYLAPYEAEAHRLIGRLHLRAGRTPEAIEALIVSLWSEPSADGHAALGEAYARAGESARARTEAERALALDPESAAARELLERLAAGSSR